jgi:hypothetical protein
MRAINNISDTTCAITAAFARCKSVKENSIGFVNENKEFAGPLRPHAGSRAGETWSRLVSRPDADSWPGRRGALFPRIEMLPSKVIRVNWRII